jgi:hypothetical protein
MLPVRLGRLAVERTTGNPVPGHSTEHQISYRTGHRQEYSLTGPGTGKDFWLNGPDTTGSPVELTEQLWSKFVSNSLMMMFLSQNHHRKLETLSNVHEKIKPVSNMSFVILLEEVQQPEVHFGDKCF